MDHNIINKKYSAAIITLGCRVNQYESRVIYEKLIEKGIVLKESNEICDLYIINTCAVTAESERKSRQLIRRCKLLNKNAVIAVLGCSSQLDIQKITDMKAADIIGGSRDKTRLAVVALDILFNGIKPDVPIVLDGTFDLFCNYIKTEKITGFDRVRSYIKIEDGCNGACSYCVIPKIRGEVILRPQNDIISEIQVLASKKCREVVLTGIETAAYGKELDILIKKINSIENIERIRLGSMDPAFLRNEFIDSVFDNEHFMPHFHISLQSGSNTTLGAMKRKYNADTAYSYLEYIKKKISSVMLSTDIICGFPGESEQDFNLTLEFIKNIKFLHIHNFIFSPRPKTEAYNMKNKISESEKKARAEELVKIQEKIKFELLSDIVNKNKPVKVLIEKHENGYLYGHSENFCEYKIKTDKNNIDMKGVIIPVLPDSHDGNIITGFDNAK